MQVAKIRKPIQHLRQGTIISISKLKFKDGNKKISFQDMYKKADLKRVNYGIVLTQTCDLVEGGQRKIKTPYINIKAS